MKSFLFIFISLLGILPISNLKAYEQSSPEIAQANYHNPQLIVNLQYYPIYGSSVQQIRNSLRTRGILYEKDGKRYAGYTRWNVQWRYYYQTQNQRCRLTQIKVQTTVTMTLPQWKVPPNTPPSLRLKWHQFSQALRKHEDGHQRHGILAGQEVLKTLQKFPPSATCPQLEQKLNETGKNIIKKYHQADIRYDQQTKHGTTQGAIF